LEFELGSLDNAGYVTTLIWAAGNAYRHAKDWDGLVSDSGVIDQTHDNYGGSKRTLGTLEASIGLERVAHQTACLAAIELLTQGVEGRRAFATLS
jgi:hypothetical protein